MDFRNLLGTLGRHPILISLGFLVAVVVAIVTTFNVSLSPLKVRTDSNRFGAAQSKLIVDTVRPSLVFGQAQTPDLVGRTHSVAALIDSGQVKMRVARSLGVRPNSISVEGPLPDNPGSNAQPVAQQRANDLVNTGSPYSVFVDTDADAPTIALFGQARTGDRARRLLAGIASALQAYLGDAYREALPGERKRISLDIRANRSRGADISSTERRRRLLDATKGRTVVRAVGRPVAGNVTDQSGALVTVSVAAAVFVGWCLLVLGGAALAGRTRRR